MIRSYCCSAAIGAAIVCMSLTSTASADSFGSGVNQFDIDFVTISGNPGVTRSTNTSGDTVETFTAGVGVSHYIDPGRDYRIGVYEITNDQWNKFKNEYGTVTGSPSNAYDESPTFTGANVPTNKVSWYEAAHFVNWLNTSMGHQAAYKFTGTQGQSDYTLDTWSAAEADNGTNLYRHKDAFYYLPTEDEWVKAAYWNGTSLHTWATPDDTVPVEDVEANYDWDSPLEPWHVGSGAEELNGTFDMMGNVWELMESPYSDPSFAVGSNRGLRGGSFYHNVYDITAAYRYKPFPDYEGNNIGFRVASEVPVADPIPAPLAVVAGGVVGLFGLMRRR